MIIIVIQIYHFVKKEVLKTISSKEKNLIHKYLRRSLPSKKYKRQTVKRSQGGQLSLPLHDGTQRDIFF